MNRLGKQFFYALCFFTMLSVKVSNAEILMRENYDAIKDGTNCKSPVPPGWGNWVGCSEDPNTYKGIAHYSGEISFPGRGGTGNSLKQWRHTNSVTDLWGTSYTGYLNPPPLPFGKYRELYARYYVRIPFGWNVSYGAGTKFNRFYTGAASGAKTGEVSFMVEGPFNSSGGLYVYTPNMGASKETFRTVTLGELGILDGNWYCLEVHYKMNTPGQADGICEIFVDGVKKHGTYNISGVYSNFYFTYSLTPGIGNTGSHFNWTYSFLMTPDEWKAIEFDDYVLSTTYVGPAGGDATPPEIPQGVRIVQ